MDLSDPLSNVSTPPRINCIDSYKIIFIGIGEYISVFAWLDLRYVVNTLLSLHSDYRMSMV
jgi:hypothetical protein